MKNTRFLIVAGLTLGMSAASHAVICSDQACENPSSNASTQSGWTINTSRVSSLKALDSVGPTGNVTGSRYFFGAVTGTGGAATLAKGSISTSGDGLQIVGLFSTVPAPGAPTTVVSGGTLTGMLGNQGYSIYAQACPSGAVLDSALCSVWAKIGTMTTLAYPTTVFGAIQKPGDATSSSIVVRTNVPTADVGDISLVNIRIENLITASQNEDLASIGWTGANVNLTIDSEYTHGFRPNAKYQYKGTVTYPAGVDVPTAAPQTVGSFWTTPVNPSNVVVSNITHCSADITARNTGGATPNPTYTKYRLCAGAICATDTAIGGTPLPTDTITETVLGLVPGTTYTPSAQARVGNGDSSETGWNSSTAVNGTNFTTDGTNGTFTISNILPTSVDFNFPGGFDVSGAVSWQRRLATNSTTPLALYGSSVGGLPPTTIDYTGLTPNTQYWVQVTVTEASCPYTVPPTPLAFTTTPNVPATFNLTASGPRQLSATWTANGNPGATTYQVQYCTDAGFTTGCQTVTTGAGATSATLSTGVIPETTYFAHVRALTVGGGSNSAYSSSDSDTTPNEAPTITSLNCPNPAGAATTTTCTSHATDNGALNGMICHFSINNGGSLTSANDQATDGSGNCPSMGVSLPGNGAFTVTLIVTDKNGTGLASNPATDIVNVGPVATTITVAPLSATVATGNTQAYTATVLDQFGTTMTGQTVAWTVTGGGSMSGTTQTGTFTAATPGGPFTVRATIGSVSGTAQVTVIAAGTFFVTPPSLTLNPDHTTGLLTALGGDNVSGEPSIIYTWSLLSGPSGASPSFSASNGTNAGKNTVVTLNKAGDYIFKCTLSNVNGATSANTPMTTLAQFLTSIDVSPSNITINVHNNQVFTATGKDQFSNAMGLSGVNWTSTGGSVTGAGVFLSNSFGNGIRVIATSGGKTGFATVNLVDYDVSGAVAGPVPYKSTTGGGVIKFFHVGTNARIRIYSTTGRLVYEHVADSDPFPWNVKNTSGENIASGVYLYVIESPTTTKHGKLIIIQ